MKVRYGKAKTPIVFGVGGVIVAMVTNICVEIAEIFLWALYQLQLFSDHLQIWYEGVNGKAKTPLVFGVGGVSFCGNILEPVTFAVFIRLSWNLAHRTHITWCCEKYVILGTAKPSVAMATTHWESNIISFSFSFCSFYLIGMKFGSHNRYNMTLWKMEYSELLRQALPWQPQIVKNNFIFL